MADILITPATGIVEFKDNGGVVDAAIQLDGSGNLNITHPGGNLNLGNPGTPVYIGDGVNTVDVIFEQSGAIRALTGKTLTIGQADSNVVLSGNITSPNTLTSTGFIGPLTGNAGTATTLQTARTIALTGDVSYTSNSFNGSANVTGVATLASVGAAGTYTKVTTDVKGRVTSGTTLSASDIPGLDAAKITSGIIDVARLPSYVDDVIEAANLAAFPVTGETGKIYVAVDTNKTYRWSGSVYVYITSGAVDSVGGYTGVITATNLLDALKTVDGTGSGLDADLLDGNSSAAFYLATNPSGYTTNTGTVTGVTATAPVASSGGTAPVISMAAASSGVNGYMTGAYATKLDGIASGATNVTNTNQLTNGAGYITSYSETDTLATVTSRGSQASASITIGSGGTYSAGSIYSDASWGMIFRARQASPSSKEFMWSTSTDTNLMTLSTSGALNTIGAITGSNLSGTNTGDNPGVTSVSGTAPVVSSGGNTPTISMAAASSGVNGYMTGAYATKLDGIAAGATNVTNTNQLTNGAGYITSSGNAATTSQRNFSGDISATGQGRFTGWYTGNAATGFAAEIGISAGQGYVFAYNRDTSAYGTMNFAGSASNLQISGGTINATTGAIQQGGNQVLHAGNYNSYSPTLTGGNASGTWGIAITGNAATASNSALLNGYGSSSSGGGDVILRTASNGYLYVNNWIHPANGTGLFYDAGVHFYELSNYMYSSTGFTAANDMRAPIFYDSNDTAYYLDPNSTSDSALRMRGGALFGPNTTWGASLYVGGNGRVGTSASVAVTNGNLHIDAQDGYSLYLNWYNTSDIYTQSNLGVGNSSASYRLHVHGTGYATSDFRAPIFYDSDDTGYYTNPNSTSNLVGLTVVNTITGSVTGSASSATSLNSSNYINRTGSSGDLNTDFQNTPAGTMRYQGDDSNLPNSPGGTWWIYEHKRHSNSSNYWGTQVAWGWEDNANKLATRNITGNSFGGWVYYLNSSNYNNYALPLSGGTLSGVLTINNTSDYQLLLQSTDSWTGIAFNDGAVSGSDYIWHNGVDNTFAFGGGGTSVAGKKLHVHGGMTIGSGYATVTNATNGLNVEGAIQQAGNQVLNASNYTSYSPSLTGTAASGTWGISVTGSSGSTTGNAATATTATNQSGGTINATSSILGTTATVGSTAISSSWLTANWSPVQMRSSAVAGGVTGLFRSIVLNVNAANTASNTPLSNQYIESSNRAVAFVAVTASGTTNSAFYWRGAPAGTAGAAITWVTPMILDANGYLLIGYGGSNGAYPLQVNGQIFATSSTIATSDARYKEDVHSLEGALDVIKALRPVQFKWKKHDIHNFNTDIPTIGFLAQEVQQVLADKPYLNSIVKLSNCILEEAEKDEDDNVIKEAVTEEFLGIAESNIIALLTSAMQEQQSIIESQEERIVRLESLILNLTGK